MKKHTVDTMTTAALRDLDPARTTVLTDAERERADATFARILATPSHDQTRSHDQVPEEADRPRRRRSRLLVPVALVGAAAAVPALLFNGGSAFASWTSKPEPLTAGAATEVATTCLDALGAQKPPQSRGLAVPDQAERVVMAERRGEWTYVLITGPKLEAACLLPDDLIGEDFPPDHKKGGFSGHYSPDPEEAPTLARDGLVQTISMGDVVDGPGLWPFGTDDYFVSVQGYVGSDVTGVTVHYPGVPDVQASVESGRFAAWWPAGPAKGRNLGEAWTYTVTLADGSTRRTSCVSSTSPC
jgi:hypothetical protein